jgi:TPP-dependent pyruvate/acetoin dehydrogenase alpha subunit
METFKKEDLISFEKEIEQEWLNGNIKAPVHFAGGNEEKLIEIFKNINEGDWVFSTHRSHYHALLKGVPKEYIKKEVLEGRSIHLNNKQHKFFTSAIVGGILPIALGTAMALKRKGSKENVWVFVGDMAAEMGIFHECVKYAERNDLPITFIVEDNGLSVDTPTQECWGKNNSESKIKRYEYKRIYPHYGCGKWVIFK